MYCTFRKMRVPRIDAMFLVTFLLATFQAAAVKTSNICVPGNNCDLPSAPIYAFYPIDTPQLVLLTVDGNASPAVSQRLFNANRRNPDDCPISVTSFVDTENMDIVATNAEIQRGIEVSLLGKVFVTTLSEKLAYRSILAVKTDMASKVPHLQEVLGWRSTDISQAGKNLFNALSYIGFTYDSSLLVARPNDGVSFQWPFRLGNGWSLSPCSRKGVCQRGDFPNLWEFPMTSLHNVKQQKACHTLTECTADLLSSDDVRDLLLGNLKMFYLGNRAPFVLRIPADWLENKTQHIDGLDAFIRQLSMFTDIYVVSIENAIKWLFNPTPVKELYRFKEWQCSLYSSELNKPYRKYPDRKGTSNYTAGSKEAQQKPVHESLLKNWESKSRKERVNILFSKRNGAADRPTLLTLYLTLICVNVLLWTLFNFN